MLETNSSGVRIRYRMVGGGPPVVLVHGYTASGKSNWLASGWADALAGRHTLLIPDLRGHGRSEKPYGPGAYSVAAMSSDVLAVMDAEGVPSAPVVGYSMGGMITMDLLVHHAERVSAAVIGGMGSYFPAKRGRFSFERQSPASEAPRRPLGARLRFLAAYALAFDPIAIESVYRGVFKGGQPVDRELLPGVHQPVLVAAGTRDVFYEPARELAGLIPGAEFVALPEEGHISAVRSPTFKAEVAAFLQRVTTRVSDR